MAQLDTKAQTQLGFSPAGCIVCSHSRISCSRFPNFIYQKHSKIVFKTSKLPNLVAFMCVLCSCITSLIFIMFAFAEIVINHHKLGKLIF